MKDKLVRAALLGVLNWAESKCPAKVESPYPCSLCGASVENLERCRAIEETLPTALLSKIKKALAETHKKSKAKRDRKAKLARARVLLDDVARNGLIYWVPTTMRGQCARARMVQEINEFLRETNDDK